jgi:hypothetical protein
MDLAGGHDVDHRVQLLQLDARAGFFDGLARRALGDRLAEFEKARR